MAEKRTRRLGSGTQFPSNFETGALLNRFTLTRLLGSGGYGQVWEAANEFGLQMALKIIPIEQDTDPGKLIRDYSITRNLNDLRHIVRYENPIIENAGGAAGDRLILIPMELMDGDMIDFKKKLQSMSIGDRVDILTSTVIPQICEGLATAHKAGIVHRDIKPGNILYSNTGNRFKLSDFGSAYSMQNLQTACMTGTAAGTAMFMAPEQLSGEPAVFRSDIYSLGITLCSVLFDTPYPGELPPDRAAFTGVLEKCIERNPSRRFQSVEELIDALGTNMPTAADPIPQVAAPRPSATSTAMDETRRALQHSYAEDEYVLSSYRLARAVVSNQFLDPNDMEITDRRIAIWEVPQEPARKHKKNLKNSIWLDDIRSVQKSRAGYRSIGYYASLAGLLASIGLIVVLAILFIIKGAGDNDGIGYILGMAFSGTGAMCAGIVMGVLDLHRRRTDVHIVGRMSGLTVKMFAEDAETFVASMQK